MIKAAAYSGTRNLYADMIPAVKSLLANSSVDRVHLLIEDDQFPYWLPDCVTVRNVSGQTYFPPDGANTNCPWTYMVLMKVALAQEFPEYDRILSLDVDTIVEKNIDGIWGTDLDGYYLAAVHDTGRPNDPEYYNGGVMYLNLEQLRHDGMDKALIDALNRRRYAFCEQEAISELCRGHIQRLPGDYNASAWTEPTLNPLIHHYAAVRNWSTEWRVKAWRDLPWADVLKRREHGNKG